MRLPSRDRALARVGDVLGSVAGSSRVLEAIAWPSDVEHAFFAAGAGALPKPAYEVDLDTIAKNLRALGELEKELAGDDPVLAWLRALTASYVDANRMLESVGTREFHALSLQIYGGARSEALDADTSNLDLATHVGGRLGAPREDDGARTLDTNAFVHDMERRIARRRVPMPMEIVIEPELSAKVICGKTKMRVREGATFDVAEAEGLYDHEIETHALTAQNGQAQAKLPFLHGGGPRTTRTQEGLAVFAELYAHALSTKRMRRIVERVKMVAMAEDGASFLDLYRHLLSFGAAPHDAFLDAERICRGGLVEGGAPFTKDASYLSGLLDVYNFLRVALHHGARDVAEVLVSGRIALEDVEALMVLRAEGVLAPPRFLPRWVARWDGLLAYFSFTSFLNEVDLEPVEARHQAILGRAISVAPPRA